MRAQDPNTIEYNGMLLNNVNSVAFELGYHPEHIRRMRRSGKIFGYKIKGGYWFDLKQTRDILTEQDITPPQTNQTVDPNYDV